MAKVVPKVSKQNMMNRSNKKPMIPSTKSGKVSKPMNKSGPIFKAKTY